MIRQKLRDIDLKITELADYLKITRPTLYKFIDSYDNGDRETINKKVLSLFDYLENNPLAGRNTILNFILNNLIIEKELGESADVTRFNKIKKFVLENPEASKTKLIELLITKPEMDLIADYLIRIEPLTKKRKLTVEEEELIGPYRKILEIIKREGN
ncbi:MAG: hypothetical protein MR659_00075 [Mollicutes bacterium]|nr:hypothetical protein [Mollicutes bacterium]